MTAQLELTFGSRMRGPVRAEEVAQLVALLTGRGWVKRKDLCILNPAWDERRVRRIAEAADGAVISWPGSPGYCLFDETTEAQISRCIAARTSQIKSEIVSLKKIRRRHYQRALVLQPSCNGSN